MASTSTVAVAPAWPQYSFFDLGQVKDVNDLAHSPDIFKTPAEIATTTSSSFGILVADIHGNIHVLNREFESIRNWQVHAKGRVTHMEERNGILVTLGEDESSRLPLLKIWDLEHKDKKTGNPALLRSIKVQHGNRPHPVSTIALSSTLSQLAIGLGDGTVLLYRNLDQSLFSGSTSLTALPKPKIVHESPSEPVTGLGFREPRLSKNDKQSDKENSYLFIVTMNRVLSYIVSGKGSGAPPTVIDEVGCGLGCAVMYQTSREMVVARDEAIYMCGPEGRGSCYAIEWPKISVTSHKNYLVIVSPPFFPSSTSASATVRNYVARAPNPAAATQTDVSKVTIIDLENKFIAYSESTFTEGVREVICDDHIYILGNDGKLFRMQEKPTSDKLNILFGKAQYRTAISLAKSNGMEPSAIAGIHKQYGDHLYLKGDHDGAVQQFVKTLGYLQPSYVIRKFLDAQRIHNLATYLQELHTRGLANSDHTTLLLNTYTKLRDVSRLDDFIKLESHRPKKSGDDGKDDVPFDLETAIRVCRQAGYLEHAAYLAKKYERHEDYLRIQIEDAGNMNDALAYLRKLGPDASATNLVKYGRALLSNLPDDTTQLLIEVCSGVASLNGVTEPEENAQASQKPAAAGLPYLSYLTYNRNSAATDTASVTTAAPTVVTAKERPAHRRTATLDQAEGSRSGSPKPPTIASTVPPVKIPSPRQFFAHFVDHPEHFTRFLEAVAFNRWAQNIEVDGGLVVLPQSAANPRSNPSDEGEKQDQTAIWNTLLELYLALSLKDGTDDASAAILKQKAVHVLNANTTLPYDATHALIVCSTHAFTEGLVLLWEKMGMYEDVLRFWMDRELVGSAYSDDADDTRSSASSRVVHYLHQYGPTHPHLYPLVLRFLTSTPALLSRHTADLAGILEHIENEKIIPPLGVVQILSRNDVASVGLVKQWLMRRIADSRAEIDADRQLIDSYRTETKTKLQEISDLSDPDRPRVFHVTRCSACGGQLDLPSVHFMCNHSYHQRCLADHETECPNCARKHGLIREIRADNEQFAGQHDLFLYNVEHEGFSAVASAFSKGVLSSVTGEDIS